MGTAVIGASVSTGHSIEKDKMIDSSDETINLSWATQDKPANSGSIDVFAGYETKTDKNLGIYLLGSGRYSLTQMEIVDDNNNNNIDTRNLSLNDWQAGLRAGGYYGHFWGDIGIGMQRENFCDSDGSYLSSECESGEISTTSMVGFDFADPKHYEQYKRNNVVLDLKLGINLFNPGISGLSFFINPSFKLEQTHSYENLSAPGDLVYRDGNSQDIWTAIKTILNNRAPAISIGVQGAFSLKDVISNFPKRKYDEVEIIQ